MADGHSASRQQKAILAKVLAKAKQNGLSQQDLGIRAGISRETVSRMKSRDTDFTTLARLAAVVGLRIDVVEDDSHVDSLRDGILDIDAFGGAG